MLGKTAGGLLWMSRHLERCENTARLVEAGQRIALTRFGAAGDEWASILATAAASEAYKDVHGAVHAMQVADFLLREEKNPSSVRASLEAARNNARLVRTSLTREAWEAINVCWLVLGEALARPLQPTTLFEVLTLIRQQCAYVRGAMHGTMLRNDIFNFIRAGTFIERADNTARILDVKYYVLLPSVSSVGSSLDNVQWEIILRAASAERSFGWLHGGEASPADIARFLILDVRMPRSLIFCCSQLVENLRLLQETGAGATASLRHAAGTLERLQGTTIEGVFDYGLHEFISEFIRENLALGALIEKDFRFHA